MIISFAERNKWIQYYRQRRFFKVVNVHVFSHLNLISNITNYILVMLHNCWKVIKNIIWDLDFYNVIKLSCYLIFATCFISSKGCVGGSQLTFFSHPYFFLTLPLPHPLKSIKKTLGRADFFFWERT